MIAKDSLSSSAHADAVLLIGLAPSSLSPISVSELHLYAYLGNLVAFSQGQPVADWGYKFFVTHEGFPFSEHLEQARRNLILQSIIWEDSGLLTPDSDLFEPEFNLMLELQQSSRRKIWQKTSLACALHMPTGAIRHAINKSPGMAVNVQQRRAGELLRSQDTDRIHEEFDAIRNVLGDHAEDTLQSAVLWLSARVLSES